MTPNSTRSTAKHLLAWLALLSTLASVRHADAVSARRLVEIADFNSPVVSPDGSSVAFRLEQASIERNTYDTVWYVQPMDGASPPRRVADGGVPFRDSAGLPLPAPAVWSPDGRWIYYRALVDGRIDIWRAATDASGAEAVTRDPADVRDFSLSSDGQVLRYSVGATREEVVTAELAEYDGGFHITRSTPIGQNLFRSGLIEGRLATERLGMWFVRAPLLADVQDRWKAVDLAQRATRELRASEVPPAPLTVYDLSEALPGEPWKLAEDTRTGRIALLTRVGERETNTARDKPHVELAVLASRKTRQPVKCRADLCTGKQITDILWRPGSDEVLFTVTDAQEGHAQSIFRWDVQTGEVRAVVHSAGLLGGGGRWEPSTCGISPWALACIAAEADRPPRLERVDMDTGKRSVLFEPNAALAWDMAKAPPRLLRWADTEGRQFTGRYFPARRASNAPAPLFINYYRCRGFVRGGAGDEWPLATLAAHGISALCIDALPHDFDAETRYDAGRSAVASAVELLAKEGEIDRTKVGMGGLSFGTETTLWTLIHSDLLAAASLATPGISHMYHLLGSMLGEAFTAQLLKNWQLGPPGETPEQWQKLDPALNLDRIHAPILMQLSEQEFIYSLGYAIPLIRDRHADVYVFAHEPHQKFQARHKLAVYERNLDWFRFWLQGVEDADPAKSAQYSHWRSMRERMSTVTGENERAHE